MSTKHLINQLEVEIFQSSLRGEKSENQDALGARLPEDDLAVTKGIALIIADGVSAAEAAREASHSCVIGFLSDYYATPDSWSVKQSAQCVLQSLNRWLYGRSQIHIQGRGFITTMSVLIIKSGCAHIFHVGDARIYRWRDNDLEQLTEDHAHHYSGHRHYLSRAIGADIFLDIDYRMTDVRKGDIYLLSTDGIHDFLTHRQILEVMSEHSESTEEIVTILNGRAIEAKSDDNMSCQAIRIIDQPDQKGDDAFRLLKELPFPPDLEPGQIVDGWKVIRQIHASTRSQLYLVEDKEGARCVMKTPSVNFEDDPGYIERFVMEGWIGSRVQSPYVVNIVPSTEKRTFLYYLTKYIPGLTLNQLIEERGKLEVTDAIDITEQISKGLRAFHRKETLHQDLKPDNIVIGKHGAVIIDFGSCLVAGIDEIQGPFQREVALGTIDYSAPEYHYGGKRSERSDQFSLALILYEMLTGEHPYGRQFEHCKTLQDFQRLKYKPARTFSPMVPLWIDGAINRALSVSQEQRYESLSEFIYDLKHPNPKYLCATDRPLIEKHPLLFWKIVSTLLLVGNLVFFYLLSFQ